jgi:hypothetical protein
MMSDNRFHNFFNYVVEQMTVQEEGIDKTRGKAETISEYRQGIQEDGPE